MEVIKFQGKEFPSVIVHMPFGERKISTCQLNEALMNLDGDYVSNEARIIDEEIFFFVEKEEILNLSETELVTKILSEM